MSGLDKENTLRMVKGQDPIQKIRCRIGIHRWTSWEYQPANYNRSNFDGSSELVRCYCADCGLVRVERPYTKSKLFKY